MNTNMQENHLADAQDLLVNYADQDKLITENVGVNACDSDLGGDLDTYA